VWPWVVETIRSSRETDRSVKRIVLTGHSLGGAVAVLISTRLEQIRVLIGPDLEVETYTFGCPRVGSADFVLPRRLFAFGNLGDQVPEICLPGKEYVGFSSSYLLANRYAIVAAPDAARIGLANWARMVEYVGDCAGRLLRSGEMNGLDYQVCEFFLKPFPNFCSPTPQMLNRFPDPFVTPPIAIYSFSSAERLKPSDRAVKWEGLGNFTFTMQTNAILDEALSEYEKMVALSRAKLPDNSLMKSLSLLLMRERHGIGSYLEHLSMGLVRL
jgi:pimeloyl-ACP methyl ester carboxylesterase